jgi:hypothetical protein
MDVLSLRDEASDNIHQLLRDNEERVLIEQVASVIEPHSFNTADRLSNLQKAVTILDIVSKRKK